MSNSSHLKLPIALLCALALSAALSYVRANAQAQGSVSAPAATVSSGVPATSTDSNTPPAASTLATSPPAPVTPTAVTAPLIQTPLPAPSGWRRQNFTVARCTAPPTIDGKLNDACWATATHVQGFYRLQSNAPVPEQTEAWLCADSRHLYIAFHCLDSHPELIRASETQRNGDISHDDLVGIDIDSQNTRRDASTFMMSANGTQVDQFEGGTASNITWAGDWRGAVARTKDGWTCEFSVPFALMRYPRGAHQFGMILYRKMARETTITGWPYVPPEAESGGNPAEAPYLGEFDGIAPPFVAPQPIFLPYTLVSGGANTSTREGLDVKYPVTTTLTGVASLFPDFQTIEQSVTDVSFSYTQKLLPDLRPFFAEGSGFLPSQTLFYSRDVGDFDGGVKLVGKTDATTVGVLGTTYRGDQHQDVQVANLAEDLGSLSKVGFSGVGDTQAGLASNQVSSLYGVYGFKSGGVPDQLSLIHDQSWLGGRQEGGNDLLSFSRQAPPGKPSYSLEYDDISPNFDSRLGYVPYTDERGYTGSASYLDQFDKGPVELRYLQFDADDYEHHTGGFYYGGGDVLGLLRFRNGVHVQQIFDVDQYTQYHDNYEKTTLFWNQHSLFDQGKFALEFGREAGQPYTYFELDQGYLVSRPFSAQLSYDESILGPTATTQLVLTGNYRLSTFRTLGGRIVAQQGHTNLYVAYGQQGRTGNDVFLIFGDPNSLSTRGEVTLKVVHPMAL